MLPEPNYPDTVLVCDWWCCHRPTARCQVEEPHDMAKCGEFDPPRFEVDPSPLGPWAMRTWVYDYDQMTVVRFLPREYAPLVHADALTEAK